MNNAMDLSVRVDEEFRKLLTERGTVMEHMSQKLSASTQQELYRQANSMAPSLVRTSRVFTIQQAVIGNLSTSK